MFSHALTYSKISNAYISTSPAGCVDLKSIVHYHSRIERTAELADISAGYVSQHLPLSITDELYSYLFKTDTNAQHLQIEIIRTGRRPSYSYYSDSDSTVIIEPRLPTPPHPQKFQSPCPAPIIINEPFQKPLVPSTPDPDVRIVDITCEPGKDVSP
jgi:hypothetical protein